MVSDAQAERRKENSWVPSPQPHRYLREPFVREKLYPEF
jgi:hypothetical protein